MSLKSAATKVMGKVIESAPDKWIPGGISDPLITPKHVTRAISSARPSLGWMAPLRSVAQQPLLLSFPVPGMLYAALAFSTIAKGRVTTLDSAAAEAAPGVHLQERAAAQTDAHLQFEAQGCRPQ